MRRVVKWLFALLLAIGAGVIVAGILLWRFPLQATVMAGRSALRWSGFEKVQAGTRFGPVTYFRGGSGPVVILVHGANDQAGGWARVAPALARDYRLVVVDLAGHGDSAPKEGPLTIRDLVDGLDAVVDAETTGSRATLVGNSLGGFLALVHASRNAGQVAHAILVNGAVDRGDASKAAVTLLPRTREEARQAMDALTSPSTARMPGFVLDDLVRRSPTSPLARLMARPDSELREFLLDDRLPELHVPVTMLWGEDDRVLSVSYARRAASRLPNARLELMPRCGHVPQRECPGVLLARLRESLARVPPAAAAPGA
jgi:pimeloyl-ACP methyl ester carboxylesterase